MKIHVDQFSGWENNFWFQQIHLQGSAANGQILFGRTSRGSLGSYEISPPQPTIRQMTILSRYMQIIGFLKFVEKTCLLPFLKLILIWQSENNTWTPPAGLTRPFWEHLVQSASHPVTWNVASWRCVRPGLSLHRKPSPNSLFPSKISFPTVPQIWRPRPRKVENLILTPGTTGGAHKTRPRTTCPKNIMTDNLQILDFRVHKLLVLLRLCTNLKETKS